MRELKGKIGLITGVGRPEGIGAAVCRELAGQGVDVFYTYWHKYDVQQFPTTIDADSFTKELAAFGVRVESVEADLSDSSAPKRLFNAVCARFGPPDFLINNACYDRAIPFTELNAEVLDRHYAVNLRAPAMLCVEFVKAWHKKRGGRIINMTSGQSIDAMNVDQIPYTVTKAGLEMLARQLAPGIIGRGITINAVDPGPTDTGWMSEEIKAKLQKDQFVNQPEDVARAIAVLLQSTADKKTGQVIHIGR
jgi:3-oxoacyl-[acyl-carrier protein] reductase